MTAVVPGLEGLLPSIRLKKCVLEETDSEVLLTLHLVAIDVVDKNGNLFWGKDYDFSQYIKYSIFLSTDDKDNELYSMLANPKRRVANIKNNLERYRDSLFSSERSAYNNKLARMDAKSIVRSLVSGVRNTGVVKSEYCSSIYPVAVNEGMDVFRPLETITSQTEDVNLKERLQRYTEIDVEGRKIYKIPAVKTIRFKKPSSQNSTYTQDQVIYDSDAAEIGVVGQQDQFGSDKFPDFKHLSCYIFSIFDFQQLMKDENINHLPMSIKDQIGSGLTYDSLLIEGENGKGMPNKSGVIYKYRDGDVEKTWFGLVHEFTADSPGPNNYIGYMGGTQESPIENIKLMVRRARTSKVEDLRGIYGTSLPMPENVAATYFDSNYTPTWLNDYDPDALPVPSNTLISDTDADFNLTLPNYSGENPKQAKRRFQKFYKDREMQKYSQGNSAMYGKMFLDQTSENHVNFLFMVDFWDIYKRNGRFASILGDSKVRSGTLDDTLDITDPNGLFSALSIKLYRRRVSRKMTGTTAFGYPDHEPIENEIPYLVAEISQTENGFTSQRSDNERLRDDPDGGFHRKSTMRNINVKVSTNPKKNKYIKSFTGTDFNVSNKGSGTYQYYIEMTFHDKAYNKLLVMYKKLLADIAWLNGLYYDSYTLYDKYDKAYLKSNKNKGLRYEAWEKFKKTYGGATAKTNISNIISNIALNCNNIIKILYNGDSLATISSVDLIVLLSPFKNHCNPENQLVFLTFLNDLRMNFGSILEMGNIPSNKYSASDATGDPNSTRAGAADTIGSDTSERDQFKVTNYFPEYISTDNTRSYFNLAYFGDIFAGPSNQYGIPIINSNELKDRLDISRTRFKIPVPSQTGLSRLVIEPRYYNSILRPGSATETSIDRYRRSQGHTRYHFHREYQRPINFMMDETGEVVKENLTSTDIKNIHTLFYQSGVSGLNSQGIKNVQRPISVDSMRRTYGSFTHRGTNVQKTKEMFEDLFTESMKEFANELGITLYTDNFPLPTALIGDAIKRNDSEDFANQIGNLADLKSQKILFKEKLKSELGIRTQMSTPRSKELIKKFTDIFSSMLLTDHDRYLSNLGMNTSMEVIEKLKLRIEEDLADTAVVTRVPMPDLIVAYMSNENVEEQNFAPHNQIILDSFKEIKMLENVRIGDNIDPSDIDNTTDDLYLANVRSQTNLEEFVSVSEDLVMSSPSGDQYVLLSVENYMHEETNIGMSEITKAPVTTKYVLLNASPVNII